MGKRKTDLKSHDRKMIKSLKLPSAGSEELAAQANRAETEELVKSGAVGKRNGGDDTDDSQDVEIGDDILGNGGNQAKSRPDIDGPKGALDDSEDEDDDSEEDVDDDDESDDEDDESSDDDEELDGNEIVDVDFEFFDPKPADFHGVKGLLKTYLDDSVWNCSEFVDTIIAQTTVGTVVKTEDDSNPIGLISCLNLHRYKDKGCIKEVKKFLRSKAGQRAEAAQLEALLARGKGAVGLLVSERLINIPFDLAGPLHTGLLDEISWATEDEPTEELRRSFKFDDYLVLTRVYQEGPQKGKGSQKKGQAGNGAKAGSASADIVYIKPEDEVFHKLSSWSFTFPVHAEAQAARQVRGLKQLRMVMAISAKKIPTFRERLKRLIEEGT